MAESGTWGVGETGRERKWGEERRVFWEMKRKGGW